MKSFLTCPHRNMQTNTVHCLDCGYNIYTTEKEYLESLRERVKAKGLSPEILKLEKDLGITQ